MSRSHRSFWRASLGLLAVLALVFGGTGTASAAFGLEEFDAEALNQDGTVSDRAGAHPFTASTEFVLNSEESEFGLGLQPEGQLRDVSVDLPAGFAGDPSEIPTCTTAEFFQDPFQISFPACPPSSQVGFIEFTATQQGLRRVPIYNMVPEPGVPAQFAFRAIAANVFLDARVRTEGDYGITISLSDLSQGYPLLSNKVTLWGTPASPVHDPIRGSYCFAGPDFICFVPGGQPANAPLRPFLTNPTSCVGPVQTGIDVKAWTGETDSGIVTSHDPFGNPIGYSHCDEVPFSPTFQVSTGQADAASPAGLKVEIGIPQNESPEGIASSHLKAATVTLPEGVAINPSSADGLQSCTSAEISLKSATPANCPAGSKLGTVKIDSPVLDAPLEGGVYLASQRSNPFGSLLAMYLVAEGEGVVIKVPGKVEPDPVTGRLKTTFPDNPQLPAERIALQFFGGPRAPLAMPQACGTYSASAELTPWVRPGESVPRSDSFQITSGPGGGPCPSGAFAPKLNAGSTNPDAGKYSPFVLRLTRDDASQRLGSIATTLPKGLLASLKGVPYCPDAALAAVPGADGTGAAQIASPSCPAASQVGTVTVGAGAGSNPFYANTGRAYLAGPYKGAPLSLAVIAPVVAGPFDLGNVVVRNAVRIDPVSTEVTVISDPIPAIQQGIPLNIRDLRIELNKHEFTLNPTSCEPMAVTSTITSIAGATATPSDRFQVANCERLEFKPKLALRFIGKTTRSSHPRLQATVTMPKGANIGKAIVLMPKTELLENAHIQTICTRDQWAADACPKGSIYGKAKAWTPLLDKPLEGNVYLRSNGGARELPDLVADLRGQIDIELVGYIDAVNARLRARFLNVPDAPVSKFMLDMQGGKKGLLAHNTNVCRTTPRASVKFDGQNGKVHDFNPVVKTSCGKK